MDLEVTVHTQSITHSSWCVSRFCSFFQTARLIWNRGCMFRISVTLAEIEDGVL